MRPGPDSLDGRAWLLLLVGLLLCTWNLGARALWQDEAACALLGERLFEHGRPLGYADGNLITMDTATADELSTLGRRVGSPAAAVEYFTERGDFHGDTSWIGQPWGSIAIAGAALKLFGHGAWQARLPFALAGVLTLFLLYRFSRAVLGERRGALVALALCTANVWWLTHVRQCRYYSTATLLALATVALYWRWRSGAARNGTRAAWAFGIAAWLWFHQDFGSFWPVIGVLALDTLLDPNARRRGWVAFLGLGAAVAPFVFLYRLHDRLKPTQLPFGERLGGLAWMLDRYQIPLWLLALALLLALRLRKSTPSARPIALVAACILAQLLWLAAVSPAPFYRYIVDLTPLSALVLAWLVVLLCNRMPSAARAPAYAAAALVLVATPWLAWPTSAAFGPKSVLFDPGSPWVRSEFAALRSDLFGDLPDPNRAAIAFLEERLEAGDEVAVTYEDLPLAFHLQVPVRGGIPCFRVLDAPPPRWLVLRRSAGFVPPGPYEVLLSRHAWTPHTLDAPDIPFGNNPDPRFHRSRYASGAAGEPARLQVLERR